MTDERMALIELIETQAGSDFVRDMLAFAADRIMEMEVDARTGAAKGGRLPLRAVQRNGYRERDWVPAPEGSRWRSRSCARAATSRALSNHVGQPRRAIVAVIQEAGACPRARPEGPRHLATLGR